MASSEGKTDMVIDPVFGKCVAFLCIADRDDQGRTYKRPVATAFLLEFPAATAGYAFYYAVTARHVIDRARPEKGLWIRFNKESGGVEHLPTNCDLWCENGSSDVAICPLRFPHSDLDFSPISHNLLLSYDELSKAPYHVRVGTELIMVGLFRRYSGQEHMQPIVRFGRVSCMPDERVPLTLSPESSPTLVEAYLAEMLSWGGESGSPVFSSTLHLANPPSIPLSLGNPRLIGLLHGHYPIEERVKSLDPQAGTIDLNAGIAVVIPAQAILDTLNSPDLAAQREAEDRADTNGVDVTLREGFKDRDREK